MYIVIYLNEVCLNGKYYYLEWIWTGFWTGIYFSMELR